MLVRLISAGGTGDGAGILQRVATEGLEELAPRRVVVLFGRAARHQGECLSTG